MQHNIQKDFLMNNIAKIILSAIGIVILFCGFLFLLPKSKITYLVDDALRDYALSHNLAPVPSTYKELLKVVDNPENPLSPAKIALGNNSFLTPSSLLIRR